MLVHCKKAKYDVYIGRPGPYGNPYSIEGLLRTYPGIKRTDVARALVIGLYKKWISAPERKKLRNLIRKNLKGKILGCWCAPFPCHGEVILEISNSPMEEE